MKAFFILLAGGLCVCVALLLLPTTAQGLPECHIHRLTGLLCPGCGLTRALRALLRGEWWLSLHNNPLVIPGFVWLAAMCCLKDHKTQQHVLWWGMAVALLFTLLRNIPHPFFDILRPLP